MAEIATTTVEIPQDKPPRWANSLMKWALSTPGFQKMVGGDVALLTFTGHKTAKTYQIPVSYDREDNKVTIVTKRARKWWRNFVTPADVELLLAGQTYAGTARVADDDTETLEFMTRYLAHRPIDAKAYGLAKDEIVREKIEQIVPHIVVIEIELEPTRDI